MKINYMNKPSETITGKDLSNNYTKYLRRCFMLDGLHCVLMLIYDGSFVCLDTGITHKIVRDFTYRFVDVEIFVYER